MSEPTSPQVSEMTPLHAHCDGNPVLIYHVERAAALERWAKRGWTPVTSGRHPLTGPVTRQSA